MSIAKVISGGQTGADLGGLRAAKAAGTATGGTMPKGWRTIDGSRPWMALEYGMVEHPSADYPPRTITNVREADITIRIAVDFESAGERLTLRVCKELEKPHVDIRVHDWKASGGIALKGKVKPARYSFAEQDVFDAIEAIFAVEKKLGRDVVINIAGNSERTAPGIGDVAEGIVKMILDGACGGTVSDGARPIYDRVAGSPFQPGDRVEVTQIIDQEMPLPSEVPALEALIGLAGVVVYLEYSCGSGQTYPHDPMIGVSLEGGLEQEFWREELAPACAIDSSPDGVAVLAT